MPLVCPIRKSPAQQPPNIGDAITFRCAIHHNFKVANSVFADWRSEEYTREGKLRCVRQSREPSLAMACYQKRGLLKAKRSLLFCNCTQLPQNAIF